MRADISYGKAQIGLYRTCATPLSGITPIPESQFTGRPNTLFAAEVNVEVFGDNFMPAYTHGDNRNVVATDTMKNFVLRKGLEFDGATLEALLYFLGEQFLATYPQMQRLRLTAEEQPFLPAHVPGEGGAGFTTSEVLFSRSRNDRGYAMLEMERGHGERGAGAGTRILDHLSGRVGLQLIKVTGSAFMSFARDEYTTLPERRDRPLFIYLDVFWRYTDPAHAAGTDPSRYIPSEQVRDFVQVVFHDFVSMSIQHLIHEMGTRLLERFPHMAEVSFEAQNRLWDTAFESQANERLKVYTDPRPPYGLIRLTLRRDGR